MQAIKIDGLVLIHGTGKTTEAYHLLANATKYGITPTRRQGGWVNADTFAKLTSRSLLEVRHDGPRGGRRWHATAFGREVVLAAIQGPEHVAGLLVRLSLTA